MREGAGLSDLAGLDREDAVWAPVRCDSPAPSSSQKNQVSIFNGLDAAETVSGNSKRKQSQATTGIFSRPFDRCMTTMPKAAKRCSVRVKLAVGIVVMRRSKGREKIPDVACDCLRFELPLTVSAAAKPLKMLT